MTENTDQQAAPAPGTDVIKTTEDWLSRQTGVEIRHTPDGRKVYGLPETLGQQVNSLVPFSQVVQLNPSYEPVPRAVRLDIERHAYKEKNGEYAINRIGLLKFVEIADIQLDETTWDFMQGTGVKAQASGKIRKPDGTWRIVRATKVVRFERLEKKVRREAIKTMRGWKNTPEEGGPRWEEYLDERVDNEMDHIDAKTESRAQGRVIRALLSINATYPKAAFAKPFFIMTWSFSPDLSSADVRQLAREEYSQGRDALYGAEPTEEVAERSEPSGDGVVEDLGEVQDEVVEGEVVGENGDEPAAEADGAMQDDWGDDDQPAIAKPDKGFKPRGGPYKGKDVSEWIGTREGRAWLKEKIPSQSETAQQKALAWLSWAVQAEITLDNLADLEDEPPA